MENKSRNVEPQIDFYLSCLEEQVRYELQDTEATLTHSSTDGRVLLEIQEHSLENLLEQLQESSQKKDLMKSQICRLKALLDEAQDKHVTSSQTDTQTQNDLKEIVQRVENDLQKQISNNRDLQLRLEALQREKEALQEEVEAGKLEVGVEKRLRTEVEKNLEATRVQKEAAELEARAMAEDLRKEMDWEKVKLRENNIKYRDKLRRAEDRLDTERFHCQQNKQSLQDKINNLEKTLKKTEEKLESDRLQWQQEKTSLLKEKLTNCVEGREETTSVLQSTEADQQLDDNHVRGQEMSCIIQSTADFIKSLQEKDQESKAIESCMKARLEELEKKVTKKKKKKWYRRFI